MKTLNDLKIGQRTRMVKIHDTEENVMKLEELGLIPGAVIRIVARAVNNGPLVIRIGDVGNTVTIKVKQADTIEIRS